MSAALLERDVNTTVARIGRQVRKVIPLMLMHRYRDVSEQDLQDYLRQLDASALEWFARNEMAANRAVVAAQFSEAEEEILALFREVRREALGLPEGPDVTGMPADEAMQALIDAYGKDALIGYVLARRGGEIHVVRGGGQRSHLGRPRDDAVTARTLTADMRELDLDPPAFASSVETWLANRAYKERRLAARGERSRLIAALREKRRARLATSRKARDRALLREEKRVESRACKRSCGDQRNDCENRAAKFYEFCQTNLPKNRVERQYGLRECDRRRRNSVRMCRSEERDCSQDCR